MANYCWCGSIADGLTCTGSKWHNILLGTHEPPEPKILYLAGPMSGYTDCNYPAFNAAAEELRGYGYTVVNPADTGANGGYYEDLIRKDLEQLLDCEGVAVLEKWWESVGARNEVCTAGILKKPVRSVNEWIIRSVSRSVNTDRQ